MTEDGEMSFCEMHAMVLHQQLRTKDPNTRKLDCLFEIDDFYASKSYIK